MQAQPTLHRRSGIRVRPVPAALASALLHLPCLSFSLSLTVPGIGNFDTDLGTLQSVDVVLNPPSTTAFGQHQHWFFAPVTGFIGSSFAGQDILVDSITTSSEGPDTIEFSIPSTATGFGTVDFPAIEVTGLFDHVHQIDFDWSTVDLDGTFQLFGGSSSVGVNTEVDVGSVTLSYTGIGLQPFLSAGPLSAWVDPAATLSVEFTHSHSIGGDYQSNLGLVSIQPTATVGESIELTLDIAAFEVESTTFNYAPIPEPSTYALIAGTLCLGYAAYRRRR